MGRIENHDGRAWRARAEECRAIAETFQNPETRERMYLMAAEYDRMAERADERRQESTEASRRGSSRSRTPESSPAGEAP